MRRRCCWPTTRDDQAETVLLGLLRSGGIDAIAGMPPTLDRDGVLFVRPFLELGRADTTAICEQLRVAWWDDPTNGEAAEGPLDARYPLRSRIRHDLMPALARFMGADVSAVLARGARSARHDKEYLDAEAERALADVACFAGTADAVDGADTAGAAGAAGAAEPAGADAVRGGGVPGTEGGAAVRCAENSAHCIRRFGGASSSMGWRP